MPPETPDTSTASRARCPREQHRWQLRPVARRGLVLLALTALTASPALAAPSALATPQIGKAAVAHSLQAAAWSLPVLQVASALSNFIGWLQGIAASICIVGVIISGINLQINGKSAEGWEQFKRRIGAAFIGLLAILLAPDIIGKIASMV